MLVPAEEAITKVLPVIQIKKNVKEILLGKPLMKSDVECSLPNKKFALFHKDIFLAVMRCF